VPCQTLVGTPGAIKRAGRLRVRDLGYAWTRVPHRRPASPAMPQQANKLTADRGAAPTAVLFDPTGKVGHAYGARTTPHMYVKLVYKGGIDDQPTARLQDLNFVDQALSVAGQAGFRHHLACLWLLD
jgi:hypothetical protein